VGFVDCSCFLKVPLKSRFPLPSLKTSTSLPPAPSIPPLPPSPLPPPSVHPPHNNPVPLPAPPRLHHAVHHCCSLALLVLPPELALVFALVGFRCFLCGAGGLVGFCGVCGFGGKEGVCILCCCSLIFSPVKRATCSIACSRILRLALRDDCKSLRRRRRWQGDFVESRDASWRFWTPRWAWAVLYWAM